MINIRKMMLDLWLNSSMYPLTITYDRYNGTYSGAKWLAFPLEACEVPQEIDGCDGECMCFWNDYNEFVGKGNTIDEAMQDLRDKIKTYLDKEIIL